MNKFIVQRTDIMQDRKTSMCVDILRCDDEKVEWNWTHSKCLPSYQSLVRAHADGCCQGASTLENDIDVQIKILTPR